MPRLLQVLENVTNWYIRFNRKRLKGVAGLGLNDTKDALNTLLQVLYTLVRALAPFIPFLTDHIYGLLKPYLGDLLTNVKDSRSVHFIPYPTLQEALFDEVTERRVAAMQKVIQLGRIARERRVVTLRTPLLSLVVIADEQRLADIESLQSYVQEELNVREVILSTDEERYNIQLEARVDWPTLGKKLKKDVGKVKKALPGLSQEQLKQYQATGKINVDGIELDENDLTIVRVLKDDQDKSEDKEGPQWEVAFAGDTIILLDCAQHADLLDDRLARDIINRVQKMRKTAGLVPTDNIGMHFVVNDNPNEIDVHTLVSSREELFVKSLRTPLKPMGTSTGDLMILEEDQTFGSLSLKLRLLRLE